MQERTTAKLVIAADASTGSVPIKIWTNDVEPEALSQLKNLSRLPFIAKQGVACRKDDAVLDEIPGSYKDIDVVMENQSSLVEVVHTLKQVMCCKGA